MSKSHACALVGLSRGTYRHVGQTSAHDMELREQIVQTAHTRRRWGYRMNYDVLRPMARGISAIPLRRLNFTQAVFANIIAAFSGCRLSDIEIEGGYDCNGSEANLTAEFR